MFNNIILIVCCVVAVGATIFGVWLERGNGENSGKDDNNNEENSI